MNYRVAPNKQTVRFIGDTSMFILNRFGVAWQELDSEVIPDWTEIQILDQRTIDQLKELALKAGAVVYRCKNGEERWNFRTMPEASKELLVADQARGN